MRSRHMVKRPTIGGRYLDLELCLYLESILAYGEFSLAAVLCEKSKHMCKVLD